MFFNREQKNTQLKVAYIKNFQISVYKFPESGIPGPFYHSSILPRILPFFSTLLPVLPVFVELSPHGQKLVVTVEGLICGQNTV